MKINTLTPSPLVRIRWLTYACFEIQADGVSIVIDPYIGVSKYTDLTAEAIEKTDYVLLSHTHFDHVTDIRYLMDKFGARVLCGQLSADSLTRWLDCNPMFVYPMNPGLELDFGACKIQALYGRHTSLRRDCNECLEYVKPVAFEQAGMCGEASDEMQRIGSLEYTNFLITLNNGTRIVFYGGTDTPEAVPILRGARPDILLTQFTSMNSHDFSNFMAAIGPKYIIPHHMDSSWPQEEYEARLERCGARLADKAPGMVLITPEHGQWYEFSMGVSPVK